MKNITQLIAAIVGAVALTGCQGTSNSSSSSGTCNYNVSTGYYTNSSTGAVCSSSASTANCTYNSSLGYYVNATTGAICSTTSTGSCILTSGGYYINSTTGATCSTASGYTTTGYTTTGYSSGSCSYWTQMYGVYYSPAYLNGQLVCVASY